MPGSVRQCLSCRNGQNARFDKSSTVIPGHATDSVIHFGSKNHKYNPSFSCSLIPNFKAAAGNLVFIPRHSTAKQMR
eukprot:1282449-Amphidinium_carterae.1